MAIARALAKEPQLLFADEPTSALDGENGQVVIRLLQRAAKEHGAAVICVTHDPRLEAYADRIIHHRGRPHPGRPARGPAAPQARRPSSRLSEPEPCSSILRRRSFWLAVLAVHRARRDLQGDEQSGALPRSSRPSRPRPSRVATPYAAIASGKADVEGGIIQVAARTSGVVSRSMSRKATR